MAKELTVKGFLNFALLAGGFVWAAATQAYQPYGYQAPGGMYPPQFSDAAYQPQGYEPQGYQPQGYQPQGYQPQGYQPQGYQPQGYQPQGYQPQGYQPQGYQPQGYQPQGYQPQGYWQSYQQQYNQPTFEPPRVEVSVTDNTPYEQQSLVYRLRVTSSGNLKSINPEIPQLSSVVLRALGDPLTTRREHGTETKFVTDYHYLLMPLASGVIEIPPAGVSGLRKGSGGADGPYFEASALEPVTLRVKPPAHDEQPWLPLYDLRIDADIQESETLAAGNPIALEVVISAVGATGAQLPSIAGQLKSNEFRIYPGKSATEGHISEDGRQLLGRRVERFTLVPQYGGWLQIPALHIDWWNVRYDRPEVAVLPMLPLEIAGPANPNPVRLKTEGTQSGESIGDSVFFWVPLAVAIVVALYGWLSAAFLGSGRMPGFTRVSGALKSVLGDLYAPVAAYAARISPRRHFHRMRTWTGRHLPVSWKLWFCMHALEKEDDPAEWGQALQILAAKHLGVRPHAHLRHIGERIVACHPRANARQVERLMVELDEAVYGSVPMKSFARWKHEFKHQIKPSLLRIRFRCRLAPQHRRELPSLNPT
ncbi:MAG: hypothetical protein PVG38_03230 [Gammaproteobacteria bacterium]|jgi:hypothetical protein